MSRPPFPMITANPPYSPGPNSPPTTVDPYGDSAAESIYEPVRQYRKRCHRCEKQDLICVENTGAHGTLARCKGCKWAHVKCEVEIDGNLVRVGTKKRSTYSKKWVYVDPKGQHIREWPFYYVEDSPSLTDVHDDPNFCKHLSSFLECNQYQQAFPSSSERNQL